MIFQIVRTHFVLMVVASFSCSTLTGYQYARSDDDVQLSASSFNRFDSYGTSLNRRLSEGVTPENNAAVEILNAVGPSALHESFRKEFYKWLDVAAPAVKGNYFISIETLADQKFGTQEENGWEWEELSKELDYICSHPWKADEYPFWNEWIDKNEQALSCFAIAATKDRYFHLLVSGKPNILIACSLSLTSQVRSMSRCILARAMRDLADSKVSAAIDDTKTVRRMANLNTQSITLVEYLVSLAMETMAFEAEAQLLGSGELTVEQCCDYQGFVSSLKPQIDIAARIDVGERSSFLDFAEQIEDLGARGVANALELESPDGLFSSLVSGSPRWPMFEYFAYSVDWSRAMQVGDEWFDRASVVWQETDDFKRMERIEEFSRQFEDHLDELNESIFDASHVISFLVSSGTRGRFMGNFMIGMFLPDLEGIGKAEIRTKVENDLAQLGFAIERFRQRNGRLPEALKDLTPEFVNRVPYDRFRNEPLIYRQTVDGYLLYSVGSDKHDNRGRRQSDPVDPELSKHDPKMANGYDIVLRVEYAN